MLDLKEIPSSGQFSAIAARLNENFNDLNVQVEKNRQSSTHGKGLYLTTTALEQAVPNPVVGDWAVTGDAIPGPISRCDTKGVWTHTEEIGGGGTVDLNSYVTGYDVDVNTLINN